MRGAKGFVIIKTGKGVWKSMKKKKARRYYLAKMLTSYLLIVFILMTCVSSCFFYFIIHSKTKELEESSQKAMTQTSVSAQILYEQVSQLGATLLSDTTVERFLSLPGSDPAFEYKLYSQLKNLRAGYPFIHSILLYHRGNEKLLSDYFGNTLLGDKPFVEQLDREMASHNSFYKLSLPSLSSSSIPKQEGILAFLFYPFRRADGAPDCSIVVFVREEYLETLISSISMNPLKEVILLDGSGEIILSTGPDILPAAWDVSGLARDFIGTASVGGQLNQHIDGRDYNITYTQSEALDWTFLSISNQESDLHSLQQMLVTLSAVSILLLLFGVATTILVTRRMYSPVYSLMEQAVHSVPLLQKEPEPPARFNEYDLIARSLQILSEYSSDLESTVERTAPLLHGAFIQKILHRTYSEQDMDAIRRLELYSLPHHRVLLVRLDHLYAFTEGPGKSARDIFVYAVQNMLNEVLRKLVQAVEMSPRAGELTFLLSHSEPVPEASVSAAVSRIQRVFQDNFQQSFSAAVGAETDFGQIHVSRENAEALFRYRFLLGAGSLLTEAAVRHLQKKPASPPEKPNAESLLAKLRAGQEFQEDFQTFFSQLRRLPPAHALTEIKIFLYQFQDIFSPAYSALFQEPPAAFLFKSPEGLETLDNIEKALLNLIAKIQVCRLRKTNEKNKETIARIKEYVLSHYSDPELTVEAAADVLGLSPGYLRKLFRASEGSGLSEFIMAVRLDAAKELLLSTNLTAAAIAEKVGIYSSTYFSTLFRKRFGTTPILYRQSLLSGQDSAGSG